MTWRGIVVISETIAAMEPGRILIGADERFIGADVDRYCGSAQFGRVESIPGCLLDGDISGDRGDRKHAYVGGAQRHD